MKDHEFFDDWNTKGQEGPRDLHRLIDAYNRALKQSYRELIWAYGLIFIMAGAIILARFM